MHYRSCVIVIGSSPLPARRSRPCLALASLSTDGLVDDQMSRSRPYCGTGPNRICSCSTASTKPSTNLLNAIANPRPSPLLYPRTWRARRAQCRRRPAPARGGERREPSWEDLGRAARVAAAKSRTCCMSLSSGTASRMSPSSRAASFSRSGDGVSQFRASTPFARRLSTIASVSLGSYGAIPCDARPRGE